MYSAVCITSHDDIAPARLRALVADSSEAPATIAYRASPGLKSNLFRCIGAPVQHNHRLDGDRHVTRRVPDRAQARANVTFLVPSRHDDRDQLEFWHRWLP